MERVLLERRAVWTSTLVLAASVLAAGCVGDAQEQAAEPMAWGTPGGPATVVALYRTLDVPTISGRVLKVIDGPGSGVLLCPDVVLTVAHVVRNIGRGQPLLVSNRLVVWTDEEIVIRNPSWPDEHRNLRIAVPEDTRTLAAPVARIGVATRRGNDGFELLQLATPYPADLPFPPLAAPTPWASGDLGTVAGYGATGYGRNDSGIRHTGRARFREYTVRSSSSPPLLGFSREQRDDVVLQSGDSGGPLFRTGPDGATALAGVNVESDLAWSFADLDVAANAAELERLRAERCGRSATDEGAFSAPVAGEPDATEAARPAFLLLPGDVVCACEGDCARNCP